MNGRAVGAGQQGLRVRPGRLGQQGPMAQLVQPDPLARKGVKALPDPLAHKATLDLQDQLVQIPPLLDRLVRLVRRGRKELPDRREPEVLLGQQAQRGRRGQTARPEQPAQRELTQQSQVQPGLRVLRGRQVQQELLVQPGRSGLLDQPARLVAESLSI